MAALDFRALAARLGVSVDQVLEVAAMGADMPQVASAPVAGCTTRPRIVLAVVQLDRSRTERARPETDAEYAAGERYFEHWSV